MLGKQLVLEIHIICNLFNISFATFISFTGSADSDTLIVSPMSSLNNVPKPILELTVPLNSVPACVTP